MDIIHNRNKFLYTVKWINAGKKKYAFHEIKKSSQVYFPLWFFYVMIFKGIQGYFDLLISLAVYIVPMLLLMYFYSKDKWLDLIYDYNDTIDHYSEVDPDFFEGIRYEKYKVLFTPDSVIIGKNKQ